MAYDVTKLLRSGANAMGLILGEGWYSSTLIGNHQYGPQRDERMGWTGDAQAFCNTAHYNLGSGAFYRQWLAALRDSFQDGKEGGFGAVAPHTGFAFGSAGWADAGVIVPWVTWLHTGDRRVLEENFAAAQRWVALIETQAPDGIRRSKPSYGDWLAPGYKPKEAPTPYVLIATAYFAHSADLVARMALIIPGAAARLALPPA